ncbi:MAG: GNAT family acetyltransferase [Caldilineaceae bacterium]|jgi:ribosomal protein S18 acetylase RimI-like enzyme
MPITIATYNNEVHRDQVVQLWRSIFGYDTPHNAPALAIDRKLAIDDGLFFVAVNDDAVLGTVVVGTVMAGYDGHRGWIYSLAVAPNYRGHGLGSRLLARAEDQLASRGCLKINLQVLPGNGNAQAFYEANGYAVEERISMGKRLFT